MNKILWTLIISTCIRSHDGIADQRYHLVVLKLDPCQIGQRVKTLGGNFVDLVVVEVNVPQAVQQRAVPKLTDRVKTRVKSLKTEAGSERVVISDLVNFVVVNVQPLE